MHLPGRVKMQVYYAKRLEQPARKETVGDSVNVGHFFRHDLIVQNPHFLKELLEPVPVSLTVGNLTGGPAKHLVADARHCGIAEI